MNRQKSLTRIAELLGRFTTEVGLLNAANLYDINIHAENVLIPLIKLAYGLDMVNANYTEEKNFSAVDLIDNKNRVAFQVTSTADNEKIKHTLNQFIKHEIPVGFLSPVRRVRRRYSKAGNRAGHPVYS